MCASLRISFRSHTASFYFFSFKRLRRTWNNKVEKISPSGAQHYLASKQSNESSCVFRLVSAISALMNTKTRLFLCTFNIILNRFGTWKPYLACWKQQAETANWFSLPTLSWKNKKRDDHNNTTKSQHVENTPVSSYFHYGFDARIKRKAINLPDEDVDFPFSNCTMEISNCWSSFESICNTSTLLSLRLGWCYPVLTYNP